MSFSLSSWQSQLLSFPNFSYIQIEEVTVENSLNATGHHGNQIEETFEVVTIDPIEYVETSIDAERKQIMARYCLSFSSLTDHEQLR